MATLIQSADQFQISLNNPVLARLSDGSFVAVGTETNGNALETRAQFFDTLGETVGDDVLLHSS